VAYSRQFYNKNVLDYNAKIDMFPSNLVASIFKFKKFDYFETSEEDKKAVKVNF
jgi:LemA protein